MCNLKTIGKLIMKNKKVVLLAVLVALIWGTISFKIVHRLTSGTGVDSKLTKVVQVSNTNVPVEYTFLLDYEDPFLKKHKQTVTTKETRSTQLRAPKIHREKTSILIVDWGKIEYIGSIYNATRNKLVATMHLAGKDYFVREGDEVQGFRIEMIHRDSVKVVYGTQSKYIKRKQ